MNTVGKREFYSLFVLFPMCWGLILGLQLWYHHNKHGISGLAIVIPAPRGKINNKLVFQDTTSLPAAQRQF